MIKMHNAYTLEVDDAGKAVKELLSQLNLDGLKKHSAGILACHSDFIESGVVEEICKRLPFDVIGSTTNSSSVNGNFGPYQLSLAVLTSDDVMFSTAQTESILPSNYEQCVKDAYLEAQAKLPGAPQMIVVFVPMVTDIAGMDFLKCFDKACGSKPIFGTVASDTSVSYENACTIRNGKSEKRAVQMLLLHGNVKPDFIVMSLSKNIRRQKAIVTESEGSLIKKINDMNVVDYFASVGITKSSSASSAVMPILVDYENSSVPVALSLYGVTENGAICTGEMPQGITFSIGTIDREGTIETANEVSDRILADSNKDAVLFFPCIVRYLILSPDCSDEMKLIEDKLHGEVPYFLSYAAAEICPICASDGKIYNKMHSYSLIACILKESN